MSAGTITLTNGSAVVGGAGTSFATELAAGDFIVSTVGGVPYTLPVKTVDGNTQVTLVSNFTGPTQAGAAWSAVPRVALNMVTAALVAQSAEALRGLNYDKQNWQQVFSAAGNITVKLPDGTTFTGPSWKYLSDNMATKSGGSVPVNQGGTGSTTASGARTNLGLGSGATKNTGTDLGNIMEVGSFGLGSALIAGSGVVDLTQRGTVTGFGYIDNSTSGGPFTGQWQVGLSIRALGAIQAQLMLIGNGAAGAAIRSISGDGWTPWTVIYTTANTTKASDGTLKAASPVARIAKNQAECQRVDIAESGFIWCGCGTANAEAEGIHISRKDVGVYELTGSAGLASEGWQLLPPKDPGGSGELGIVEAEQDDDNGSLTIRLYRRIFKFVGGEIVKTKGELIDVPANSWIDVRLDMPENSIWNQKLEQSEILS